MYTITGYDAFNWKMINVSINWFLNALSILPDPWYYAQQCLNVVLTLLWLKKSPYSSSSPNRQCPPHFVAIPSNHTKLDISYHNFPHSEYYSMVWSAREPLNFKIRFFNKFQVLALLCDLSERSFEKCYSINIKLKIQLKFQSYSTENALKMFLKIWNKPWIV